MTGLNAISWLFAVLVLIVFCNRYIFGSIARLLDRRTEKGFGVDPDGLAARFHYRARFQ